MSAPPRHDPPPKTAATDQGPLSPSGVKVLKIAVVVMGIMIVAGIALVIGRVIYLASSGTPGNARTIDSQALNPRYTLPLPAAARLDQVSLHGDRLLVRYEINGRTELAIYDLRQGRIITTIVVGAAHAPVAVPTGPAGSGQ